MYKTTELITNILDNPNIDSNYIDSIINYDICNMFISLLEETQNIHNSIKDTILTGGVPPPRLPKSWSAAGLQVM